MNGDVHYPTQAQAEQLAFFTEETGEALHAVGKVNRHGYDSRWPKHDGPSNLDRLEEEIGHVLAAIDILVETGAVDVERIASSRVDKLHGVQTWLHCDENIEAAQAVYVSIIGPSIESSERKGVLAAMRSMYAVERERFRRAALALLVDQPETIHAFAWSLQCAVGEVSVAEALDGLRRRIAEDHPLCMDEHASGAVCRKKKGHVPANQHSDGRLSW